MGAGAISASRLMIRIVMRMGNGKRFELLSILVWRGDG